MNVTKQLALSGDYYEADYVRFYEYGRGYMELGMWSEAAAEFAQVPAAHTYGVFMRAQTALVFAETRLGLYDQAADRGLAQIGRGQWRRDLLASTALALHHAGRTQEACALYRRYPEYLDDSDNLYGRACYESALGSFDAALNYLERSLRASDGYALTALIDSDLAPLWRAWDAHPPTLEQAHRLVMPGISVMLERVAAYQGEFEMDIDGLKYVPAKFRPLLTIPVAGSAPRLDWKAQKYEPELARGYLAWQREEADANTRRLRTAIACAWDLVLNAQPDYAGEKADYGNFLGARWHLTWALGERPSLLARFLAEPRLQRWKTELLEPAAVAQAADLDFFPRLARAVAIGPDAACRVLEEIPAELLSNPFYQMRVAAHWQERRENERALRVFLSLCQAWREDTAPFCNAAVSLMRMGWNDDAERVLDTAPASARSLEHWTVLRRAAAVGSNDFRLPPLKPFRGQPDLGGLLPPRLVQPELFRDGSVLAPDRARQTAHQ